MASVKSALTYIRNMDNKIPKMLTVGCTLEEHPDADNYSAEESDHLYKLIVMDRFYEILREGQGYGVEIMFEPMLGVRFVGSRAHEWNQRLSEEFLDGEIITADTLADEGIRISKFEIEKWNEQ
jgi:hypothetical protein